MGAMRILLEPFLVSVTDTCSIRQLYPVSSNLVPFRNQIEKRIPLIRTGVWKPDSIHDAGYRKRVGRRLGLAQHFPSVLIPILFKVETAPRDFAIAKAQEQSRAQLGILLAAFAQLENVHRSSEIAVELSTSSDVVCSYVFIFRFRSSLVTSLHRSIRIAKCVV